MKDVNKVTVRIAGGEYTLRGTEPDSYIRQVAALVDRRHLEITRLNPSLSTTMAAVMTAVTIAEDLTKADEGRKAAEQEQSELRRRLQALNDEHARTLAELSKLKATAGDDGSRHEAAILKADNDSLRIALDGLKLQNESLKASFGALRSESENAHTEAARLKITCETLKSDCETWRERAAAQSGPSDALQGALDDKAGLENELEEMRIAFDSLTGDNEALGAELAELKARQSELQAALEEKRNQPSGQTAAIASQRAIIEEQDAALAGQQAVIGEQTALIAELRARVAEGEEAIGRMRLDGIRMEEELRDLHGLLDSI